MWDEVIDRYTGLEKLKKMEEFVMHERLHYRVYPRQENLFRALKLTPYDDVKVLILGQDPYHGKGQANGLAFSVDRGVKAPPSLVNIFKELGDDLGIQRTDTDLSDWARNGVLLLNSVLSVREACPTSHARLGWEEISDGIIRALSDREQPMVFILWGAFSIAKSSLIDSGRHLVLKSPHPSPLSAYRGFFGSKPFSKTQRFLNKEIFV